MRSRRCRLLRQVCAGLLRHHEGCVPVWPARRVVRCASRARRGRPPHAEMRKPRIMPIFERRVGVKTSGLDTNLRELGSPISLPGALQFVSDLKPRALEAERVPAYTLTQWKSAKSLGESVAHGSTRSAPALSSLMRGQRHNRHVASGHHFSPSDRRSCSEAIHLRHLDVHQDQVYDFLIQQREHLAAVTGHQDGVPALPQNTRGHGLIDRVVFGEQAGSRCRMARRGSHYNLTW